MGNEQHKAPGRDPGRSPFGPLIECSGSERADPSADGAGSLG